MNSEAWGDSASGSVPPAPGAAWGDSASGSVPPAPGFARPEAPGPVARQLEAYNRQDVRGFADCYTDDVIIEDALQGVLARGRSELEARYAKTFAQHPDNRARILNRSVLGAWVFEEEEVTRSGSTFRVLVVYKLRGELIERATFFK